MAHAVASTLIDTLHCALTNSRNHLFILVNVITSSLVIKIGRGSTMLLHCIECFTVQLESGNRRYKHRIICKCFGKGGEKDKENSVTEI